MTDASSPVIVPGEIERTATRKWVKKGDVVELPVPHGVGQREFIEWDGNGVAFCGRRWGKTFGAAQRILINAAKKPGIYWWIGLNWKSASMKTAWDILEWYSSQAIVSLGYRPAKFINKSNFEIKWPNGSQIWARTAERPESLAGAGIMGAVVDEFTLMPELVWTEYLQGTLLDYGGWVLFTGVPKGENWGARMWRKAKSGEMGEKWKAWRFSSYDNPYIDNAEIDDVKKIAPDAIFRQEYLAEIIDDIGQVFSNVGPAAVAFMQEEPADGHVYVGGVDLARQNDFTVITVIDVTLGEICYMQRFNQLSLEYQEEQILAVAQRFGLASLVVEETGIGMHMAERLGSRGQNVIAFKTSNQSKDVIISALKAAIEQGELKLLHEMYPVGEVAVGELRAFGMTQLAGGSWRYGAPSGEHDDCVMSIAFAWHGAGRRKTPLSFDWSPISFKNTQQSVWRY